jgi:DegV family protein with EDD domain
MLRIVTDGAADMPPDWEEKYQINILPLYIRFGEECYLQGPDFKKEDFYRLVREKRIIPKTSLPSIGDIQAFYRSIAEIGDTILSIHVSSRLSGTFSTVQAAANDLAGEYKIIVLDSLAGSAAEAFIAREARLMDRAGAALPEIMRRLEGICQRITIIFTLDTLEFAYLSGRINAMQNLIVAALKVKPIIILRDGLLDIADKVRTRQRSIDFVLNKLQEKLGDRLVNVAVVHAADPQTAQVMYAKVTGMLNVHESILTDLAIPVAANLGPGAIGVIAYPVEEKS